LNEEEEETIDKIELAYDVVRAIVDEIVPNSLELYLGVHEDMGGMGEGDDGDDGEGDDGDDDDDEEEEKPKPKKKGPAGGQGGKKDEKGGDEAKPECKQQ